MATETKPPTRTSVILPVREPYMQQIVSGAKNYEFRKYRLPESVERIWFYRTAPHSSIEYICSILPAQTRGLGQTPLEENGLGNREFIKVSQRLGGCGFAYKVVSVYQLKVHVTLKKPPAALRVQVSTTGHGVYCPSDGQWHQFVGGRGIDLELGGWTELNTR